MTSRGVPEGYRWPRSEVLGACSGGGICEGGKPGGGGTSWVSRTLETGVLPVGLSRDGGGGDRMETQCSAVPVGSHVGPIRSKSRAIIFADPFLPFFPPCLKLSSTIHTRAIIPLRIPVLLLGRGDATTRSRY